MTISVHLYLPNIDGKGFSRDLSHFIDGIVRYVQNLQD